MHIQACATHKQKQRQVARLCARCASPFLSPQTSSSRQVLLVSSFKEEATGAKNSSYMSVVVQLEKHETGIPTWMAGLQSLSCSPLHGDLYYKRPRATLDDRISHRARASEVTPWLARSRAHATHARKHRFPWARASSCVLSWASEGFPCWLTHALQTRSHPGMHVPVYTPA